MKLLPRQTSPYSGTGSRWCRIESRRRLRFDLLRGPWCSALVLPVRGARCVPPRRGAHRAPSPGSQFTPLTGRPPGSREVFPPVRSAALSISRRILTPNQRRRFDPTATDPREPITAREVRLYGVLRPGPATFRPRPVNGAQNGSEEPPDVFPAPRAGKTGRGPRRRACRIRAGPSASGPPRTSWDTADRGQVLLDRRHRSGCPRPEVSRCSLPRQTSA